MVRLLSAFEGTLPFACEKYGCCARGIGGWLSGLVGLVVMVCNTFPKFQTLFERDLEMPKAS